MFLQVTWHSPKHHVRQHCRWGQKADRWKQIRNVAVGLETEEPTTSNINLSNNVIFCADVVWSSIDYGQSTITTHELGFLKLAEWYKVFKIITAKINVLTLCIRRCLLLLLVRVPELSNIIEVVLLWRSYRMVWIAEKEQTGVLYFLFTAPLKQLKHWGLVINKSTKLC